MRIELQLTLSFSKLGVPKLLRNHQTDACYRWPRRSISLERNARAESASILFPSGPLFLPPPIPVSRSCAVSSTGICGFERKERTNADVFIAYEFFSRDSIILLMQGLCFVSLSTPGCFRISEKEKQRGRVVQCTIVWRPDSPARRKADFEYYRWNLNNNVITHPLTRWPSRHQFPWPSAVAKLHRAVATAGARPCKVCN